MENISTQSYFTINISSRYINIYNLDDVCIYIFFTCVVEMRIEICSIKSTATMNFCPDVGGHMQCTSK